MLKSVRLEKIYSYLTKNLVTADIGCDHGLLICEYALNNKCDCYGIDNKEKPLSNAISTKKKIEDSGHQLNNLHLLVNDGIVDLDNNIKQLVISGMGGENIASILNKNINLVRKIENFVLQPNNDSFILRESLNKLNLKIVDEDLVKEDGIIYEVIKVQQGKQKLTYKEKYFGPSILTRKNDLFKEKYLEESKRLTKTYNSIPHKYILKRNKFRKIIKMIDKEI